jgi:hypothetical protein
MRNEFHGRDWKRLLKETDASAEPDPDAGGL